MCRFRDSFEMRSGFAHLYHAIQQKTAASQQKEGCRRVFYAFRASSDALFYVPHKCSQTEHRVVLVELTQTLKNRLYQFILNNSKDGIVH